MLHPQELLSAYNCGPLRLRNRITAAPIVTGFEHLADLNFLQNRLLEYARDGVSMVTVAAGIVHKTGRPVRGTYVFTEKRAFEHRKITEALHREHCRAVLQLIHAGPQADVLFPVSSQHLFVPRTGKHAHGTNNYRLKKIISAYAQTARHAISAGYDGVEILASGLSLPAVFLSPTTNNRKDVWGNNQLGRFKLSLDIVRAVRKEIGQNKAIGFRFNLLELTPTGAGWDEILRLIQMLRMAGVDYLCADFGGIADTIPDQSFDMPPGVWNDAYQALAENTELTVVFGHGFGSLEAADTLSQQYGNTLFELSDELLGDKRYIHKSLGLVDEPAIPWIDLQGQERYNDIFRTDPVFNLVNPFDAFSSEATLRPTEKPKKIVVIGAGPAGIYFSLIAAKRGHHVQIIEKNNEIGGSLRSLYKIFKSEKILSWINFLENKLKLSTVNVKLNTKATATEILQLKDVNRIVLAPGIESEMPDISGIDSSNVMTFNEMLQESLPVGNRVAVIGTNATALSICRYLLNYNKEKPLPPEKWRAAWGIGDIREHAGGVLGFVPEVAPSSRSVYLMESERKQLQALSSTPSQALKLKWLLINGLHTLDDINIEAVDNYSVRVSSGDRHTDRFTVRIDHVVVCSDMFVTDELPETLSRHNREFILIGAATARRGQQLIKATIKQAVEVALHI